MSDNRKRVVVIGGGTGTSVVLNGLKESRLDLDLTAIVTVSDSGGSTGRLRDEFGFLPVGDLRQCLAALASGKNQQLVRQLLLYRFSKGEGLSGHNLGNLILTALEDLAETPAQAIEQASRIFRVKGRVYPITQENVQLVIEYESGLKVMGEHFLDDAKTGGQRILKISLMPSASIYAKSAQAIKEADLVVLGPGDLYASLLPNTLVDGFFSAISECQGEFVYVVNLMTHYAQTDQMTAADHFKEVERYAKRKPDVVIMNSGQISPAILQKYAKAHEYPVVDDLDLIDANQVMRLDLVTQIEVVQDTADSVTRSLLRHNHLRLAAALTDLL
ncbi:MAG: Gluconeogenesis factor [Microgenomates group bacterium ADurb.Bin238]|nr:MAG: Gluconeogenesis factor [Microgenomates group bacterium ADurb.Bin238]HQM15862.1 YvcK family protein [Candidatus Woesebacteria bacterium]